MFKKCLHYVQHDLNIICLVVIGPRVHIWRYHHVVCIYIPVKWILKWQLILSTTTLLCPALVNNKLLNKLSTPVLSKINIIISSTRTPPVKKSLPTSSYIKNYSCLLLEEVVVVVVVVVAWSLVDSYPSRSHSSIFVHPTHAPARAHTHTFAVITPTLTTEY